MKCKLKQIHWLVLITTYIIYVFCISSAISAEPDGSTAYNLVNELGQTLEESLKAEQNNLTVYQDRLDRAEREQIYFVAAANAYQLQLSTYGNLLLSTGVDISLLQKTLSELKSSSVEIQKMIDEISPGGETLILESKNLEQQKHLVEKQISELERLNTEGENGENTQTFKKTAKEFAAVLKKKEINVLKLDNIYKKRLTNLTEIQKSFSTLEIQFASVIEQRKTKNLFERKKEVFRVDALKALKEDIQFLFQQGKLIIDPGFWIKGGKKLWQSAGLLAVSFFLVLFGALILLIRTKKSISDIQTLSSVKQLGNWHIMAAKIVTLSVIPGGMALILFFYSRLDTMYMVAPIFQMMASLLLVFLVLTWTNHVLGDFVAEVIGKKKNALPLKGFFRIASIFAFIYVPIYLTLGRDSLLLVVFRMTGALCMLAWTFKIWRNINFNSVHNTEGQENRKKVVISMGSKYLFVTIGSVSLVLDMTGYGLLSVYWLLSWAISAMILFWWAIFYALIQEWDQYYKEKSSKERNELLYDSYPIQWLLIRAGQFLWLVSLVAAILLAWGNQQTVLGRLYNSLAHPLTIGNMKFSLMGFIYAALVILITYALTRMWKWIFQSKFLSRSGMTIGLQDSITTISIYIIWLFGILVSLHVFGLNTASLAVAFGALGIGLGFGLQNIFNNFLSGVILLFERPIQVGDHVEFNGTWAQVRKINVRSTVVQTYDNASLIIPNADLISNQVTNWSFKDKRIRRNIDIGVAYGSDIDLVRDTLLEIAKNTKKVLRFPKPEVIFRDFGDSALIFRLRAWTDIDSMVIVETDIRFRIDKLFKERKIEISFPQRDIHIRSLEGVNTDDKEKVSNINDTISENKD